MNAYKYRNFINDDPILDFLYTQELYKQDNFLEGFDEDLLLENYTRTNKKVFISKIIEYLGNDVIMIGKDCFVMRTSKLRKYFTNFDYFPGDSYSLFTIEYSSIQVLKDGQVSQKHRFYNFKNWLYTVETTYDIDNSFIIGRKYNVYDSFNFLAKNPYKFDQLLLQADEHFRNIRSRTIGVDIFPNMKNTSDYPWHNAKKIISSKYKELTSVKGISVKRRDELVSSGILSYDCINLDRSDRFFKNFKRLPLPESECLLFIDFEILTSVYDDFTSFPRSNTSDLLFNIGCSDPYTGEIMSWTCSDSKTEVEMIKEFSNFLNYLDTATVTLVHWTNIEKRIFDQKLIGSNVNKKIEWFDLHNYFVESDIYIRGCLNYKLKNVSRCFEQHGLIKSKWDNGLFFDGLGAMTGFIKYLNTFDESIMDDIVYYNTIDCKVMMEIYEVIRTDIICPI